MEALTPPVAVPPARGPRKPMSRRIVALEVGQSTTFPYLERSTVTGLANYWEDKLGRTYVSRRDQKDRSRVRLYRVA